MKKLFLLLTIPFMACTMMADIVDADQAATRAVSAMKSGSHHLRALKAPTVTPPLTLAHTMRANQAQPTVYVYNVAGGGVVVAPSDDNFAPVLGYIEEGRFSNEDCPDGLKYLLEEYSRAIASSYTLQPHKEDTTPSTSRRLSAPMKAPKAKVDALLKNIKWNQSAPYNDLCPTYTYQGGTYRCPTGCVATAMAQIMYYHKWPAKGVGSKSYTYTLTDYTGGTSKKTASSTFSAHTYDWANMIDQYENGNYTEKQAAAVSRLLFDVGVSVEMEYGARGSGALSGKVPDALVKYFGYANTVDLLYRSQYTTAEWNNILKTELSSDRPIYLSGANNEGGHAFVCDGYNEEGFYHINWGWNGLSNGNFLISSLDPDQQGVGGSSAGYNLALDAIIGIQPAKENATGQAPTLFYDYLEESNTLTTIQASTNPNKYTITCGVCTLVRQFEGIVAYEVYNDKNELVGGGRNVKDYQQNVTIQGSGSISYDVDSKIINNSSYLKFYVYYQQKGSTEWNTLRTRSGTDCAELQENTFGVFQKPTIEGSDVTVTSTNLITGGAAEITVQIKGIREYDGYVWGLLYDESNSLIGFSSNARVNIGKDETTTTHLTVDELPNIAGNYMLVMAYDLGDSGEFLCDDEGDVCVAYLTVKKATGTETMELGLTEFTVTPEITYDGQISFSATIRNNGNGSGTTDLTLLIYDKSLNYMGSYSFPNTYTFAAGQSHTLNYSVDVSFLDYGEYALYLYHQDNGEAEGDFFYPGAPFTYADKTTVKVGTISSNPGETPTFIGLDGRRTSTPKNIFIQSDAKHSTKHITR